MRKRVLSLLSAALIAGCAVYVFYSFNFRKDREILAQKMADEIYSLGQDFAQAELDLMEPLASSKKRDFATIEKLVELRFRALKVYNPNHPGISENLYSLLKAISREHAYGLYYAKFPSEISANQQAAFEEAENDPGWQWCEDLRSKFRSLMVYDGLVRKAGSRPEMDSYKTEYEELRLEIIRLLKAGPVKRIELADGRPILEAFGEEILEKLRQMQ